jgi:hypothetical protein
MNAGQSWAEARRLRMLRAANEASRVHCADPNRHHIQSILSRPLHLCSHLTLNCWLSTAVLLNPLRRVLRDLSLCNWMCCDPECSQNTCHRPAWGPSTRTTPVVNRPALRSSYYAGLTGGGETEAAAPVRFELSAAVCSHLFAVQPIHFRQFQMSKPDRHRGNRVPRHSAFSQHLEAQPVCLSAGPRSAQLLLPWF